MKIQMKYYNKIERHTFISGARASGQRRTYSFLQEQYTFSIFWLQKFWKGFTKS